MRVISLKRLRDFWTKHTDAQIALRTWYKIAKRADWADIADVRKVMPKTDPVPLKCGITATVFNIKGNEYRLVVRIEYPFHTIYVKEVMTHAEYDLGKWKVRLCQE